MAASKSWPHTLKRITQRALLALVIAWAVVAALVYWQQEKLIFHPVPLPADYRFTVPGVEEASVPVAGATLSALHFRLPDPKGVVFFLHGNSGNLDSWLTSVEFYRRANFDLFILDYRGYGKSSGKIESEAQLHEDVRAAWKFIAPRYAGKKIVVYGRSLGTGLAAELASEIQPDLTVLVSPYLSLNAMAQLRYPWLPAFINRYPMHTDQWLPGIRTPVLIVHGDIDGVIPLEQGQALAAVRPGTELVVVPGAGHNDIHKFPLYLGALLAHLSAL